MAFFWVFFKKTLKILDTKLGILDKFLANFVCGICLNFQEFRKNLKNLKTEIPNPEIWTPRFPPQKPRKSGGPPRKSGGDPRKSRKSGGGTPKIPRFWGPPPGKSWGGPPGKIRGGDPPKSRKIRVPGPKIWGSPREIPGGPREILGGTPPGKSRGGTPPEPQKSPIFGPPGGKIRVPRGPQNPQILGSRGGPENPKIRGGPENLVFRGPAGTDFLDPKIPRFGVLKKSEFSRGSENPDFRGPPEIFSGLPFLLKF